MSMSVLATSMRPNTAGRVCGGSLIVCRATYGPRFCGAIAASATRGSCARLKARELPFLLKLRLTANVKRMIEKLASTREWADAGQGFEAKESEVRLVGWSRRRRVIVLRRRLKDAVGLGLSDDGGPPQLAFVEIGEAADVYEYSVLVTSLDEDVEAFGQLYRDRGDGENIFDEMKNQWGWGGYTTHDLARCRLRGAAACAHLQLVEHLRPARRSPPPSRGDHQPSPVPDGDRHPHPSCAANDDPRDELARQGRARRPGACGRRRLPAGPGQKCGAVDPPANMASDLVARLPGLPQRPPPPRPAPPRAKLMQPKREKSLTPKRHIGQLPFLGLWVSLGKREEVADRCGDFRGVSLQRKVSGVEEPHDRIWHVAFERLGARGKEERIVLTPHRKKRRPVSAEIILERRVERDIALVVAEQVELHLIGAGSGHVEIVKRVAVWRNSRRVGNAMCVLPDGRFGLEEGAERLTVLLEASSQ